MNSLFEAINTATVAGVMKWEPTGQTFRKGLVDLEGCTCNYKGFKLTTLVSGAGKEGRDRACGLLIEKDNKSLILADKPEISASLPVRKVDGDKLFTLVCLAGSMAEERDIEGLLLEELNKDII